MVRTMKRISVRLVGCAAAAGAALLLSSCAGPSTPVAANHPTSTATVLAGTVGTSSADVTVVMDGWSVQNLNGGLSYTADDGVLTPVGLAPATPSAVAELARTTPKILTQVAARTITADVTLSCSAAGCKTATTTYPLTAFTHPASTPLGKSYTGYAIPSLLYVAKLSVAKGNTSVELTTSGGAHLQLDLKSAGGPGTTGYGRGRHLVAAGLGQLFSPLALWVGTAPADPAWYTTDRLSDRPADLAVATAAALATLRAPAEPMLSLAGLAVPLASARTWNPDRLTYATSPTMGCGPTTLCVPGKVSTVVTSNAFDSRAVCSDAAHAVARLQDTVVSTTLPGPTNQFVSDTTRNGGSPIVLTGKQTLRLSVLSLIDDQSGVIVSAGGQVQRGDGSPATIADALANLSFGGVTYKGC